MDVNIRGMRFDPEQIANVLRQNPQVRLVYSLIVKNINKKPLIFTYIVPFTNGTISPSKLREASITKLPISLVPDIFMIVPEIPKNEEGHIDNKKLLSIQIQHQGYRLPRDATDILIWNIWTDLLERLVGIDDDFFAVGGHSLLAVEMLSHIEKHTGQKLPISIMLTNSTIRRLSAAVNQMVTPTVEGEIITLQNGKGGRPLFFLHGDYTGGGFFAKAIAQHADLDGPFYAVQPYGLGRSKEMEFPDSLEQMAANHLTTIRLLQPYGPYRLAGHCNGGVLTFEIAQQLVRVGEKVELLAMIDPPALHTKHHEAHSEPVNRNKGEIEYRSWLHYHYSKLLAAYSPSTYSHPITFILLNKQAQHMDQRLKWQRIVPHISIYEVNTKVKGHLRALVQNTEAIGRILGETISNIEL